MHLQNWNYRLSVARLEPDCAQLHACMPYYTLNTKIHSSCATQSLIPKTHYSSATQSLIPMHWYTDKVVTQTTSWCNTKSHSHYSSHVPY